MARMVKTSIELDETLLREAIEILGEGTTQKVAVNEALRAFTRSVLVEKLVADVKRQGPQELDKLRSEAWAR